MEVCQILQEVSGTVSFVGHSMNARPWWTESSAWCVRQTHGEVSVTSVIPVTTLWMLVLRL